MSIHVFFVRSDRNKISVRTFHLLFPILAKFGIGAVHVMTLNISEFCENRRWTGRSTVVCGGGGQRSYIHMRTGETCDILTVKNASVKSMCHVTECSICSLVGLSFSPPGVLPSAGPLVSEDTRCISAVVQFACRGRHKAPVFLFSLFAVFLAWVRLASSRLIFV